MPDRAPFGRVGTRPGVTKAMRKSKEIRGKRRIAALEYKKGNRKEAYKLWAEAKIELDELRGRNKPAEPAEASG